MAPKRIKKSDLKKFESKVKARSLRRPTPSRTMGKTILIVCEDAKSSVDYFKELRSKLKIQTASVEVYGKECGSDPKSVVAYAKQLKKDAISSPVRDEYDEVFCVVDIDQHTTLGDAFQQARDNNIDLVISNPCFEYWYVLHFKRAGSGYTHHRDVQKELRDILRQEFKDKHYEYDKSGCKFFEKIYSKRLTAIKNSKFILRSQHKGKTDLRECNPSTHVHRIVDCMIEMAKKNK